jgi:hypothetical protein
LKLPWVSRKQYEELERLKDTLDKDRLDAMAQLRKTTDQLRQTTDEFKELFVTHQNMLGELDLHKTSHANLRVLCNEQQTKLKDWLEPAISREDLKQTLRRLSFVQSKSEALERMNDDLRALVATWRGRAEVASLPPTPEEPNEPSNDQASGRSES